MRKYFAAVLSAVLLCGCSNEIRPEISETESTSKIISEAAVTTAATEKVTTEKTEDTTVTTTVPTEITTNEATTVTEPAQPEAILPAEAVKIDFGSIHKDTKYYSKYTILDRENILVLYKFTEDKDFSAKASIFSASDGTEKVSIDIPLTRADTFFIRNNAYFDDENILCEIHGCIWDDNIYTEKSCTTVYTDLTYESELYSLGGIGFWETCADTLPGGRRISRSEYGNLWDSESGDLLLNAVYDGPYNKSNIYYSYEFPIDENRFVYSMGGYEWNWGFGIYDFKSGTARDVPDVFDYHPMGYHDGKIYSYYCEHDGFTDNILYVTDINTLDTTPFHKFDTSEYDNTDITADYDYVCDYTMTPDGKFLMNTKYSSKDGISKVILYSTDTLEAVKEYEFKRVFLTSYTQFTEDGKTVIEDYKHKCLYIIDLNK